MGNILLKTRLRRRSNSRFENVRLSGKILPAKVLEVYDGDTITVGFRFNGGYWRSSVRLYGIDAPELRPRKANRSIESLNQERKAAILARDFLSDMILDKIVEVHVSPKNTDKYGRLLGAVFIKNKNVSELMLEHEHARRYFGKNKIEYDDFLTES